MSDDVQDSRVAPGVKMTISVSERRGYGFTRCQACEGRVS